MTAIRDSLRGWQSDALAAWIAAGRCAIVEAVTGTGKTTLGLAAAEDALGRGLKVLVVVPSTPLVDQWHNAARRAFTDIRIGRRGGDFHEEMGDVDLLITTVQSAYKDHFAVPDGPALCVADEVHRYGSDSYSRVLRSSFAERLGLTATIERSDDGVESRLLPYFVQAISGCDYARAREDRIIAPIRVMTVAVQFSALEFSEYQHAEDVLKRERWNLVTDHGCRNEPFGLFFHDVEELAKNGGYRGARSATRYLSAFASRRSLLATSQAKLKALKELGSVLTAAGRTIVFSETKESASAAADALVSAGVYAESISSSNDPDERARLLRKFGDGSITAVTAPRILDEGIDVPEADVGVILAASSSRRQMIQRIGRVIRPKPDGRSASFVVLYVQGTVEDPARGAHESFLEQLTDIADESIDVRASDSVAVLANWLGQSFDVVESARQMPRVQALTAVVNGGDVVDPVRSGLIGDYLAGGYADSGDKAFDILLGCLAILPPRQIQVLVTRFGLAGSARQSVRQTARHLEMAPRDVVRAEDEALGRLENQDVKPVLELLSAAHMVPSKESRPTPASMPRLVLR